MFLNKVLTKEFLEEKYVNKKLSMTFISSLIPCDTTTIRKYLIKYGISRRNGEKIYNKKLLTKEFLIGNYINKNKTISQISKETNISVSILWRNLAKFGLYKRINPSKEYLIDNYLNKRFSCFKIAKNLNCSLGLIKRHLLKYGISIRNRSEAQKGRKFTKEHRLKISKNKLGKKYNCRGITLFHFIIRTLQANNIWRNKILKRDHYTCQDCDSKQKLEVHHIRDFAFILKEFLQKYFYLDPIEDKEELVRLAILYKPFWNISNGRTLCFNCHNLVENNKLKKEKKDVAY